MESLPVPPPFRPSRVLRIAGIRVITGRPEFRHAGRAGDWMQLTPEARDAAIAKARAALAADPALSVRSAERDAGIPRGYLADRLRAEVRRAALAAAAALHARTGNLLESAARHGLCARDLARHLAARKAK